MTHGQNHLTDVFGLGFFLVFKGDLADLGDTVHNVSHILPEIFVDFLNTGLGVLHRVVQESGGHRGFVKTHGGQNIRHGQRMGQVGFTGKTRLSCMVSSCIDIGLLNQLQIGFMVVGGYFVENFLNAYHGTLLRGWEFSDQPGREKRTASELRDATGNSWLPFMVALIVAPVKADGACCPRETEKVFQPWTHGFLGIEIFCHIAYFSPCTARMLST